MVREWVSGWVGFIWDGIAVFEGGGVVGLNVHLSPEAGVRGMYLGFNVPCISLPFCSHYPFVIELSCADCQLRVVLSSLSSLSNK